MKKILSVLLAVAMMFAICVPVFADTEINQASQDQTAQTEVKTKTEKSDGSDPSNYTVSIPAEVPIAWDDTSAHDIVYTVTTQLKIGAKIAVSAAADNGGKMTATGTDKKLTFVLSNGDAEEFGEFVNGAQPTTKPSVAIASFSGAPVAEYSGTVTFTVVYTPVA